MPCFYLQVARGWTSRLMPFFGYCEQIINDHECARIIMIETFLEHMPQNGITWTYSRMIYRFLRKSRLISKVSVHSQQQYTKVTILNVTFANKHSWLWKFCLGEMIICTHILPKDFERFQSVYWPSLSFFFSSFLPYLIF